MGHDTVVLPMQNEDGSLNYVSRLPLAVESGASWGDPARNQRLRALNERGSCTPWRKFPACEISSSYKTTPPSPCGG